MEVCVVGDSQWLHLTKRPIIKLTRNKSSRPSVRGVTKRRSANRKHILFPAVHFLQHAIHMPGENIAAEYLLFVLETH